MVDFPLWAVELNLLLVATLCKSGKAERLTKAEGLPKNISIEEFFASKAAEPSAAQSTEFFASKATTGRADFPTFDKWYRKTHKKVYTITVTGMTELKHLIEKLEVVY